MKFRRIQLRLTSTTLLFCLACCQSLLAAEKTQESEQASSEDPSETYLLMAPYLWATSIKGKVGLQGLSAPIEISAGDLANQIDSGGMSFGRLQRGDYFVTGEAFFFDYKNPALDIFFDQEVISKVRFLELGAGKSYRIENSEQPIIFSPYVGLRFTKISASISGNLASAASNDTWYAPVVGLFIEMPLNDRWLTQSKFDIAGLGVGDNDSVSAITTIGYKANRKLTWIAGYRWADSDYERDNGLNFELQGNGPLLGFSYRLDLQ